MEQLGFNMGRAPAFPSRPARCERPAFTPGDRLARGKATLVVRESCEHLTILDHEGERDNRKALELSTPRLWESVWGRCYTLKRAGRA